MRNFISLVSIITVLAIVSSCRPVIVYERELSKYDYAIAKADNNYSLTTAQLYKKLSESTLLASGGILDKPLVERLVDSIVTDTLIGLKAGEVDLSDYYEYSSRYKASYSSILSDVFYKTQIYNQISADTSEIFGYIREHQEEFALKEQMQTRHILVSKLGLKHGPDSVKYQAMTDSALEQVSKEIAFDLESRISSKEEYIEIAREYSHDEVSARRGGLIEWVQPGFFAWPFDSVAFAASPGDVVGPYRDKDGWQILYIENYIPEGVPPLNPEQYSTARSKVLRDKTRKFSVSVFDTLFENIEVEYNEPLYDSNIYLLDKSTWAAIVNQTDTIDFGELRVGEETIRQTYKVSNSTSKMKKEMVNLMARQWVIIQRARKFRLDTLPHIMGQIFSLKHRYSRLIVEREIVNNRWEATTQQMRDYYQKHLDEYVVEKPFNVQHILVEDSLLAVFIRDQAMAGGDFMKLAKEYYPGEESIRVELANLGFIGPDDVSPEFFNAARVTGAGQISRPVRTEYGYHLIKVLEKKRTVPFDRASLTIKKILKKSELKRQKEEFKKSLFAKYNVSISKKIYSMHLKPYAERSESD